MSLLPVNTAYAPQLLDRIAEEGGEKRDKKKMLINSKAFNT